MNAPTFPRCRRRRSSAPWSRGSPFRKRRLERLDNRTGLRSCVETMPPALSRLAIRRANGSGAKRKVGTMSLAQIGRYEINYVDEGEGIPVIMIHGLAGDLS